MEKTYKTKTNTTHPQVLLLGVGNILMGDEGIGVRVVEYLLEHYEIPPSVEVVDGGTSGMELIGYFEEKDAIFIIDAIEKKEMTPGDVVILDLPEIGVIYRNRISPHQLGISEVLSVATLHEKLPSMVKLIGIKPKNIDPGLELSPEVKASLEKVERLLLKELERLNVVLLKRKASSAE